MTKRTPRHRHRNSFRQLDPRWQLALCQLPLTAIVAVLALATPLVWPALMHNPLYVAGIGLHIALFLACLLVPWKRLAHRSYLLIPVLDLLAIGLLRNGAAPSLSGLAILAVFPVIWLAISPKLTGVSMVLSFFGPLLILAPPLAARFPRISASDVTITFLVPLMTLSVFLAIRFARVRVRQQQRELAEKDSDLRKALLESKEREKLLKAVLDAADVGIAAVDSSGRFLVSNDRQRNFRQVTGAEEPVSGQGHQLIFGQDRSTLLAPEKRPINRAIAGESFADYLVWAGEGAEQRAVSTSARPLIDDDGRLTGAVVAYSDVTGWVEALAANHELVSNVTHEFRTPLNSIMGNVDLLLDDIAALPPQLSQRLLTVQRNTERLLALISDLAASASASLNVHPKRTDLSGLVETSLGSAQAQAAKANIRLTADIPAQLWVHADPLRIGQALDNLVSNAIKYSPNGGRVTITARNSEDWIQLSVSDTGMGISSEDKGRVFQRFFRAESARKAAITGAGLGLAITRTIVERHGGKITCASRQGQGSTFTLTLPAGDPLPAS